MSEGISTILLTKNCAAHLEECLSSLKDFLRPDLGDEIVIVDTGSSDNTISVALSHGATVLSRPDLCVPGMHDLVREFLPDEAQKLLEDPQFKDGFLADFAAARQIGTDAAKNDLVFWIDSDDILTGGAALRTFCSEFFTKPEHNHLFLRYDYSFDEDGACNTVLWRERILRRSLYKWCGVCHESMVPNNGAPTTVNRFSEAAIVHKNGRHHTYSDIRNYAILYNAWKTAAEKKEWLDPRWEYYLGNACRGLSRWPEAIKWYTRVLKRSGSREDRLSCTLNIAYSYILFGRPWRAIDWFFQAIKIFPSEPRAYFGIARAYYELRRFKDCVLYTEMGRALPAPSQLTSVDPNAFDFYPGVFLALAHKHLGNAPHALQALEEVESLRGANPATQDLSKEIRSWAARQQALSAVNAVCSMAASKDAALTLMRQVRPEIRANIPELQVETYTGKPKKSITFLCGVTSEPWDPTSVESGIGGSEKMVIMLAKEFASRGWRVDVYGNPNPENRYKSFDGVTYRPAESFNPTLERDILIIWRGWGYLDAPLKARKIFMDLHDVQSPADYTPARLAKLSGIFFKSEFHLDPVRGLASPLAIVTRNAIDCTHFTTVSDTPRVRKRLAYTSSPDRGLKRALQLFARIKAIHPDAELHLFYGFSKLYLERSAAIDYSYFGDEDCERHMLDYAEECFDLATKLGVTNHGRVGHKALADFLRTCSVVLYPTSFPEISCMSAMEAQAAGAFPVATAFGALPETVRYGTLVTPTDRAVDDDAFVRSVCSYFDAGDDLTTVRVNMSVSALRDFNLSDLASSWISHFEKP